MVCHDEISNSTQEIELVVSTGVSIPKDNIHDIQDTQPQEKIKPVVYPGDSSTESTTKRVWLLFYCFIGILVTFTINGMALEQLTNVHVMGENSLTFVTSLVYAIFAIGLKHVTKEAPSNLPSKYFFFLSVLAFISTISSVIALRYITFITRVLGKSCKSIPVMFLGVCLGKRYALKKYLSVGFLSIGVAIFLLGSSHKHKKDHSSSKDAKSDSEMLFGFALLVLSLFCDGATGALEDKFMHEYSVGAFELMFQLNFYKAIFACCGVIIANESVKSSLSPSMVPLFVLSVSGACGQAVIFFTISKFGALTTSIMGTMRKVVSIALSVTFFHHILNSEQVVGLFLAFGAIAMNWIRLPSARSRSDTPLMIESTGPNDVDHLLSDEALSRSCNKLDFIDDDGEFETMTGQQQRALELLLQWETTSMQEATVAV